MDRLRPNASTAFTRTKALIYRNKIGSSSCQPIDKLGSLAYTDLAPCWYLHVARGSASPVTATPTNRASASRRGSFVSGLPSGLIVRLWQYYVIVPQGKLTCKAVVNR